MLFYERFGWFKRVDNNVLVCLYYLSVGDGVIINSHLRIDMLEVPAKAPAVHFLPQRYTL